MQQALRQEQILTVLRQHSHPTTAAFLADHLNVAIRTVYRDIASMIASGIPVLSETGIGYVLEAGYDLPPLMFNAEELEALMLGAEMVRKRGDEALGAAAERAFAKIAYALPTKLKTLAKHPSLRVIPVPFHTLDKVDLAKVRTALRDARKLAIVYRDEAGAVTQRIVWPVILGFYEQKRMLVAWCETRADFRHFRTDRIEDLDVLFDKPPIDRVTLEARWQTETFSLRDEPCPETSS
jgi:predicted DNA-binding transcriptional regulator YafY